jgi:hypothetical protein
MTSGEFSRGGNPDMYRLVLKVLLLCVFLSAASLGAQENAPPDQPLGRGRINPSFAKLQPGAEQQFDATIEAPLFDFARLAEKVTWTVNDIVGGDAKVGTIDAQGLYRAPARAPEPHEVHIRAEVEGVANRFLFATALVGAPELAYTMTSSWNRPEGLRLPDPHSIALDPQGNILIADSIANRVYRFSRDGKLLLEIGSGAGEASKSKDTPTTPVPRPGAPMAITGNWGGEPRGYLSGPRVALSDSSGMIYVVDVAVRRPMIQVFDSEGRFQYSFGRHGVLPGELQRSHGMAFDSKGRLHVEDVDSLRINTYEHTGKFLSSWGHEGTLPGDLNAPHGIYIDPNDEIFIIGYYGPTQKFTADGRFLLAFAYADPPDHAVSFQSLCGDRWGNVYVPMRRAGLAKFSNTGEFLGWVMKGHAVQWAAVAPDGTVLLLPALPSKGEGKPRATVEVYSEQ